MYSQNREEEVILKVFQNKTDGCFLDIGAFHPKSLSNTRALYERGWGGVFVEPNPSQNALFKDEYKGCDNIQICENAIASVAGKMKFYISPNDALSTLSESHLVKWHTVKFVESTVDAITVDMLFDQYGYDFDFISLDVEGNNWEIFQRFPFGKLNKLKCICVEYDNFFNEISTMLSQNGFSVVAVNGENIIGVRL